VGNDMNEKQESEYLYDKRFICDVCNREFTAKQVRTGKARFEGTDDKNLSIQGLIVPSMT
jgi:uncharacterized protein (DUF2225 family)